MGFNDQDLLTSAWFSEAVYNDHVEALLYAVGRKVEFVGNIANPFIIVVENATIYIAFRGSENIENWLTNMDIRLTSWELGGGGRVHLGFQGAYLLLRHTLAERLVKHFQGGDRKIQRVIVSGHSSGGVFASMFCMDFLGRPQSPECPQFYCVTFGSPRIGDRKWARRFEKLVGPENIFRFVDSNDIVPRFPMYFFQYRHAGRLYFFDRNGNLRRGASFLLRLWNQLVDRIWRGRIVAGILDHSMRTYKKLLGNCALILIVPHE